MEQAFVSCFCLTAMRNSNFAAYKRNEGVDKPFCFLINNTDFRCSVRPPAVTLYSAFLVLDELLVWFYIEGGTIGPSLVIPVSA